MKTSSLFERLTILIKGLKLLRFKDSITKKLETSCFLLYFEPAKSALSKIILGLNFLIFLTKVFTIFTSFTAECNTFRKKNIHKNVAIEKVDLLNAINMNYENIEHLKTGKWSYKTQLAL